MGQTFHYGRSARLFPTVNSNEDRATSVFLATINIVDAYRVLLMKTLERTVSRRGKDFSVFVHPQFGGRNSPKDIPDGMILVEKGGKQWKALIEVKIKNADLDQGQLERYLNRAIEKKCDALITISNEMCSSPDNPPLRLISRDRKFKRIGYYHWSWKYLLHVAKHLLDNDLVDDKTQEKVLAEFVTFLRDSGSGVTGFTSMNRNWKEFVSTKKVGGIPQQQHYEDVVSDWHQETSELMLILSEHLEQDVKLVLDKQVKGKPELRLKQDVDILKKTGELASIFDIDGYDHPLNVSLDIDHRSLHFSVVRELTDRVKTPYKRIEHFLKELHAHTGEESGRHDNVHLFAKWPYLQNLTDTTMFDAMQAMNLDELQSSKLIHKDKDSIQHLVIKYSPKGVSAAIQSPTKIVQKIESEILFFCDHYLG